MTKQVAQKPDELASFFNPKDITDRKRHIATLRNHYNSAEAAFKALEEVKQRRLYRPYNSIKDFCEKECGWTVRRLNQLISFTRIKSKLPAKWEPLVPNERVARELARVPEEEREAVLAEASKDGKVTAKRIKEIAGKPPEEDKIIDLDGTGWPIPEPALEVWRRRGDAKDILAVACRARDMMQELMVQQASEHPDLLYAEVHCNTLYALLSKVCTIFKKAIPYAVCTVCQGQKPETCVFCKGRGMVSKHLYDTSSPSEIKEMRAKQK